MNGKKQNFFAWYYNEGIHDLLEIWKNFLGFVWRHFSIVELFNTFFLPWHRDTAVVNWQGTHPLKALSMLFEDIIARIIGAVVRLVTIFFGLFFFLAMLIAGLTINFLWISAPLVGLILIIYSANGLLDPLITSGLLLFWFIFSGVCYRNSLEIALEDLQPEELAKLPVFEKICGRLGLSRKRFPKEILGSQEMLDDFLKIRNLTAEDYSRIMQWELQNEQEKIEARKFWRQENLDKITPIGRQWTAEYTSNLDRYCKDLLKNKNTAPLVGRADEYAVLKLLLERPDQNCALLVGAPGIGKKTLINSLASNLRFEKEEGFEGARMLALDLERAVSDVTKHKKDIEDFLCSLFQEASQAGNVILVIKNLEYFLEKDSNKFHVDISSALVEFLNVPSFRVIVTLTPKEYHQLIGENQSVIKCFEAIEMREPSADETITILLSQLEKYERHRILFTFNALKSIVVDSGKYGSECPLPKRAFDLAMDVLVFWEKNSDEQFVNEKTVNEYLALKTGISL